MRKIYMTTFVILFSSFFLSNSLSAQGAFGKGDVSVNAGFSLGLIGYGYAGYGSTGFALPLTANVEFALNNRLGVAPYAGFLSRSYGTTGDLYRFTSIAFGGQADLHLSALINN
ncbi:MAG TPA: hypothetical protein VE870_09375, partial [Bacteroidales bacterium]|nr:hypothetical protein [Bacteroidales bacterium]